MKNKILLIEDNDDDVLMIKRGFRKGQIKNELHRVSNGEEAYEYLQKATLSEIQLIILDLNMEVMNGFEFLEKRQAIHEISKIPVVVLTSSSRKQDIDKSYKLGANSYVEKPLNPIKFMEAIMSIEKFWIIFAKRP